ncbi:MAG: CRISPR-associated protein Csx19 [Defluviitaleaceae bacterium]|nr:CRISPR-associated protein Csx19 [Defluviitaleaceae bacterium]
MIDCNTFEGKAWAYTVMYHGVAIGIWDGENLLFHDTTQFRWDYVTELRVFDDKREVRFIRDELGNLLFRDSKELENCKDYTKQDAEYLMYGTDLAYEGNWTILTEDRGGQLYFPGKLALKKDDIYMWLGIRNFLRIVESSVGGVRLEVCDYVFTGFKEGAMKGLVDIDA